MIRLKAFFIGIFISSFSFAQISDVSITEIIKTENGFQLLRNGSPYYVNGAGGTEYLDVLKSIGGNSLFNNLDFLILYLVFGLNL